MSRLRFTGMFWLRLGILLFGLLVASLGLYAWMNGNLWFTVYNPRFGSFGTGPTVMFIFFGLCIVVFGLFSKGWESISPAEQKRLERNGKKKDSTWK